ncbi:hypothetical protein rosag_48700 [Roseisolibacter agri]|uniref:Uncharacterized protein n=1 Tax=Roseisolibacter agri TaxID=2014610 RepID=A0AA37QBN1_9BACT|nr:hypothetical protein rosag_48700 [Roseisolibacter agri]
MAPVECERHRTHTEPSVVIGRYPIFILAMPFAVRVRRTDASRAARHAARTTQPPDFRSARRPLVRNPDARAARRARARTHNPLARKHFRKSHDAARLSP